MVRLPAAANPSTSTASTIATATLSQMDSVVATQQLAPQFVETTLSSIITRPSPSSQPLLTILVSTPTSSLAPVFSLSLPTTDVTSISPAASTIPTASGPSDSSSVPFSSTVLTASIVTVAVATSSALTPSAETSSSEIALASKTPTATTVTEAVVEVPSSSPVQATNDDGAVTEGGHHAPFYIAVIVGTILAVGLIAAVIAWAVRLRMHARRRRENPLVPWANHHEKGCALEACRDAMFIGQPINRSGSKDISSQDAIPWEPCGDRDVGEPKRSDSYMDSSLRSSLVPGPAPYPEHQSYPVHAHNVIYSVPYYGDTARYPNTSSEGGLDGYGSGSSLGPLQVANQTPADASPSSSCTSIPVSMYTAHTGWTSDSRHRPQFSESYGEDVQRSQIPPRGTQETWDTLPPPLPGRTQNRSVETITDDSSSWTASLKSNFTNAFNAVAASLPSGAALMINRQDKNFDGLSPQLTQRSGRRSLFSAFSRSNSSASQPWTLEERGDGTGRVLFHDLEADGHNDGLTTSEFQPGATPVRRISTRDSISPLVAQPRRSAMLKPNTYETESDYGRSLRQPSMRSTLSTTSSSSAYSMVSAISSAPRLPVLSRHSTIKLDSPMATVFERRERNIPQNHSHKRPAVTRSSSSGCSVHSYYYGADATHAERLESTEGDDESKQQALVDRRRSRRVV
ncbi:hypothetical protein C0995_005910 [Termitomyces sp. Mi166|nr:hypothetical protein C0995_005910 [Termitomyces sp. Mi166\